MDDRLQETLAHYTATSEGYRDWWAPVLERMAGPMLDAIPLPNGARVLDVGCGTGIAMQRLAARPVILDRLIGGDLTPAMLRVARAAVPRAELVRIDAVRLPFPDRVFDVVVSTFILQHIREQRRVLGEIHRVLKPGGRALLLTWGPHDANCPAMTAWDDLLIAMGGPETDAGAPPVWNEEINSASGLEGLATPIGFRSESIAVTFGEYAFTPDSLAGLRRGVGAGRRRYLAIPPGRRAAFDARARELLATLPPEAFIWRPDVVSTRLLKPGPATPDDQL